MTVEEVLAEIRRLSPEERAIVLAAAEVAPGVEAERYERGRAAWERLMSGLGTAGGKCLSEGTDEALYRANRRTAAGRGC